MSTKWTLDIARASYGLEDVVKDVHLEVDVGELLLLVGGNASGKSTCLKAAVGLVPLAAGRLRRDGCQIDLRGLKGPPKGVAYLPQHQGLFPSLSVRENLEVACFGIPKRERNHLERAVHRLLPDLEGFSSCLGADLSGGQKRLVSLAIAVIRQPQLMLLDEPCAGLDTIASERLVEVIKRLLRTSGTATIVAEHRIDMFAQLAQSAVGLRRGEVAYQGAASDLTRADAVERIFGLEGGNR